MNFDSVLAGRDLTPIYQYVQDIFQFGYKASTAENRVEIRSDAGPLGDYIIAARPANATYALKGNITPLGVTLPPQATSLASFCLETSGPGSHARHPAAWEPPLLGFPDKN